MFNTYFASIFTSNSQFDQPKLASVESLITELTRSELEVKSRLKTLKWTKKQDSSWQKYIVPVFKKKDKDKSGNNVPISLLSNVYNLEYSWLTSGTILAN